MNMANKMYRNTGKTDFLEEKLAEPGAKGVMDNMLDLYGNDSDNFFENPELLKCLDDEMSNLSETNRMIIRYHYLEGKKDSEIAECMPQYKTAQSVKVVRNRCIKQLGRMVRESAERAGLMEMYEDRVVA